MLRAERGLLGDVVGTDPDDAGTQRGELTGQVAEMTAFPGTAVRHRRRVEEDHQRTLGQQAGQVQHRARLIDTRQIPNPIPDIHAAILT